MLLFYEHEPDSVEISTTLLPLSTPPPTHPISSLPQYPSYAFIPYLPLCPPSQPSSSTTTTTSPTTTKPPLLTLHNTSTWTYAGPLLPATPSTLPPSFYTWSARTTSTPSLLLEHLLPLLSFLQTFLSAAGAQHYWLTLRATKKTAEYDVPRWHVDEDFFVEGEGEGAMSSGGSGSGGSGGGGRLEVGKGKGMGMGTKRTSWKLTTTLLGPRTLFIAHPHQHSARHILSTTQVTESKNNAHTCTSIRCPACATCTSSVRSKLATYLAGQEVVTPAYGEVSFFRIGAHNGAVHSEPKCADGDRIFVNVVPGTEGELRGLMARWGMVGWPRAWCFGVPVEFGVGDRDGVAVEGGGSGLEDGEGVRESTMSANMGEEYRGWLADRGFEGARVFG